MLKITPGRLIVGIILLVVVGGAGAFLATSQLIRLNDTYTLAMEAVRDCAWCGDALGAPIKSGWLVTGEINYRDDGGSAALTIPVSGRRADGVVTALGLRENGQWSLAHLRMETGDESWVVVGIDIDPSNVGSR